MVRVAVVHAQSGKNADSLPVKNTSLAKLMVSSYLGVFKLHRKLYGLEMYYEVA